MTRNVRDRPSIAMRLSGLTILMLLLVACVAPMVAAERDVAKGADHWSFQPVRRPGVPDVANRAWVHNGIDAFILAGLEAEGLAPAPEAERTALLRRLYHDVIGLPPTPDETRRYLEDPRPDAYERRVDALLASPLYGERWARHWLDLVRYAETNSFERDGAKPFVWRYRDYVIRSLNADKPYDRFIREQLAGDELETVTPETIIATGYYRLGQWDDEPSDKKQALYDDLDDIVSTTAQALLGLRINCARCHDHKLDPIPQTDYYRFLAFFRGVRRYGVRSHESVVDASLRTIAPEMERKRHAVAVAAHEKKVAANHQAVAGIEAIVQEKFTGVDKDEFKSDANRERIVKKFVPDVLSEKQFKRYVALRRKRDALNQARPRALAQALSVKEIGADAPPTFVLTRGSPHAEGPRVEPGFPVVLSPPEPSVVPLNNGSKSSGRRRALAAWIADEKNPLTARVMVNRLWQHHFGRGIVRSPNDFGTSGEPPTHPALLDWLADEFVRNGWRLKRMHRLMLTSSTYRMSSRGNADAAAKDPTNDAFWRFNPRRLSAEEIRDAVHALSGRLNLKMFGPSYYSEISKEVLAGQSQPGHGWGKSPPAERGRRSLYIHVKRSLITPILADFDFADTDSTCPVRFATVQPAQALGMLNGKFLNDHAEVFADRLRREAGDDVTAQVKRALELALCRAPDAKSVNRGVALVASLQNEHGVDAKTALKYYCLMVLNLNEFVFLD